ncbi:MAG TPA: hypothetical protein PKE29_13545 [Phycisphaerales bacterium]|nr:hypothetical protein [Phycisphaerales bacterium]
MLNPFQRLLGLLAGSSHADLRRQVQFLKAENQILRRKLPQSVPTTAAEKARLVMLGRPLGKALNDLLSIVSRRTFNR